MVLFIFFYWNLRDLLEWSCCLLITLELLPKLWCLFLHASKPEAHPLQGSSLLVANGGASGNDGPLASTLAWEPSLLMWWIWWIFFLTKLVDFCRKWWKWATLWRCLMFLNVSDTIHMFNVFIFLWIISPSLRSFRRIHSLNHSGCVHLLNEKW